MPEVRVYPSHAHPPEAFLAAYPVARFTAMDRAGGLPIADNPGNVILRVS